MILGSIVAIFLGRKYDYVFGYNLGALTDMVPAILIRKLYRKPVLFWVQDLWPDSVYTAAIIYIIQYILTQPRDQLT